VTNEIVPITCHSDLTTVLAFLIEAGGLVLIDSGGSDDPRGPIAAALRDRGHALSQLCTIVHTHGHWDHAGGDAAVRAATGVEIMIHEAGEPLLTDLHRHLAGYATDALRLLAQQTDLDEIVDGFPARFGGAVTANRLLHDGDEIDLGAGVVLTVIDVPGHSADHVALYWASAGVLFAGDAAQGTGSRRGGCPLYFESVRQARASISRLRQVPFRTLYLSHPFGRLQSDQRATSYSTAEGDAFLRESLEALTMMEEAMQSTRSLPAETPFLDRAQAATAHLQQTAPWPLQLHPVAGVPSSAAPTFARIWQEIEPGAQPAARTTR